MILNAKIASWDVEKDQNKSMIKISEFGDSKILANRAQTTGTLCGSPGYIAPEVFEQKYDARVDVFSFGVILYILIFKERPFPSKSRKEYELMMKSRKPIQLPYQLPSIINDLLTSCLSFDIQSRPDFEQICAILSKCIANHHEEQKQSVQQLPPQLQPPPPLSTSPPGVQPLQIHHFPQQSHNQMYAADPSFVHSGNNQQFFHYPPYSPLPLVNQPPLSSNPPPNLQNHQYIPEFIPIHPHQQHLLPPEFKDQFFGFTPLPQQQHLLQEVGNQQLFGFSPIHHSTNNENKDGQVLSSSQQNNPPDHQYSHVPYHQYVQPKIQGFNDQANQTNQLGAPVPNRSPFPKESGMNKLHRDTPDPRGRHPQPKEVSPTRERRAKKNRPPLSQAFFNGATPGRANVTERT